jgi:hypothetical protein
LHAKTRKKREIKMDSTIPSAELKGNVEDALVTTVKFLMDKIYEKTTYSVTEEGMNQLDDFVAHRLRPGDAWVSFEVFPAGQELHAVPVQPEIVVNMKEVRKDVDHFVAISESIVLPGMFEPILARIEAFEREQERRQTAKAEAEAKASESEWEMIEQTGAVVPGVVVGSTKTRAKARKRARKRAREMLLEEEKRRLAEFSLKSDNENRPFVPPESQDPTWCPDENVPDIADASKNKPSSPSVEWEDMSF